ncbi:MAG: EAL domain-containing protein [Pseudomonadota bacterium]
MTVFPERRRIRRVSPERIFLRFFLALVLIISTICISFTVSILYARTGSLDEEILNISGRQRMLSQRIVLAAFRYNDTQDPEYYRILTESLATFTESHHWLLSTLTHGTPAWDHYFAEDGPQLDARSTEFVSTVWGIVHAQATGPASIELLRAAETLAFFELLATLNDAVFLFEEAANVRSEKHEIFQKAAMLFILLMIGLQAIFVFRPSHQQLSGMLKRLQTDAELDVSTRLSNRRHFIGETQMHLENHQHSLDSVFLLALDLDGFKQVNDTLGHPAGDVVLRSVASDLRRIFSESNELSLFELARQGADEFLAFGVVIGGDAATVAESIADQIIKDVSKPIEVSLKGANRSEARVGVSVGIAVGSDVRGNIDILIANADIALYSSKKAGRGVATAFRTSMRDEAEARNRWVNEIKRGLQEFEFDAYFQPQIEVATGRVTGLEALARWHHPQHGLIEPAHFIEHIEQARKSDLLDGQIILRSVEALQNLRKNGCFIERMSVNASGALLRDPALSGTLADIVREHRLLPQDFTIEVLESVVLESGEDEAIASVRRLMREGFNVAIDDFGTGYSSLETVAMIGGTILKIDRSLVQHISDPRIYKILAAAIAMGHGLGARVYAEGVETNAQLERLRQMGVEVVQGKIVSEPVSLSRLKDWLTSLPQTPADGGGPPAPLWRLNSLRGGPEFERVPEGGVT